ncbi:hypothetical protein NC652_000155 [Populus alba x Populus x berolinensis]|nr:hypothetical protein NC652_000155 [Populus alba x Populus x berolinensis]
MKLGLSRACLYSCCCTPIFLFINAVFNNN